MVVGTQIEIVVVGEGENRETHGGVALEETMSEIVTSCSLRKMLDVGNGQ